MTESQQPTILFEIMERGFELLRFSDRYGVQCSLQQSSLAEFEPPGTSAVWLGINDKEAINGKSRMHFDRKQVMWLINTLILWLAEGTFQQNVENHHD